MSIISKFFGGFLFALVLMSIGFPISVGISFVANAATAAFGVIGGISVFLFGTAVAVGAATAIFD